MIHLQPYVYRNLRFRSKVQAELAWWFDQFEVAWAYEPETLVSTEVGGRVTPDFMLPELETLVFLQSRVLPTDWTLVREIVPALGRQVLFLKFDRHVTASKPPVPDPAHLVVCEDGFFPVVSGAPRPAYACVTAPGFFWHHQFFKGISHVKTVAEKAHIFMLRCPVCGYVYWMHRAGSTLCGRCRLSQHDPPFAWQKAVAPATHVRTLDQARYLVDAARKLSGGK